MSSVGHYANCSIYSLGTPLRAGRPLTDWFPRFVKPVRDGWYKTRIAIGRYKGESAYLVGWSYFMTAADKWGPQFYITHEAKPRVYRNWLVATQDKEWCGLYQEPQQ